MSLERAALHSGISLVDYGVDRGHSVLLGSGCGLMMATMDAMPEFRWCADLDKGGTAIDFAILAQRSVRLIGLVGWFSISSPAAFESILAAQLACPVVAYAGHLAIGHVSLDGFLCHVSQIAAGLPQPEPALNGQILEWEQVAKNPGELPGARLASGVLGITVSRRSNVEQVCHAQGNT